MEGLTDEPRPGAPRKITDEAVEQAVTQTLESLPRAATHWSTRSLAAEVGLSQSAVVRIWRSFGLQPHRRHRHQEFLKFMETVDAAVPADAGKIYLVLDNYGTHKTPQGNS